MPRASIADRHQSFPLTASALSAEGTGINRQYLPPRVDSSDFVLLEEQISPKCETPFPGRPWITVQNLMPLALSSPEKSWHVWITSKHILHSQFTVQTVVCKTMQFMQRYNSTGQNRLQYIVTACHSTDTHTNDSNDCYSLRVLLLRVLRLVVNSERHWNCTMQCAFTVW